MSMDASAIQKIIDLTRASEEERQIGGVSYHATGLEQIRPIVDYAQPFRVFSLDGLMRYVYRCGDAIAPGSFLRVDSHDKVSVVSLLDDRKKREIYVQAEAESSGYTFDRMMDIETFIVQLQAGFVHDDNVYNILKVVGNLVHETSVRAEDDGYSQSVTAKTGLGKREIVDLPNPVKLCPYRTFSEIEQPTIEYILRIKSGDNGFGISLTEVANPYWQTKTVQRICDYLIEWMHRHLVEEDPAGQTLNVIG